jgi:hypothetical protein
MESEQNISVVSRISQRMRAYLGGVASIGEGMATFDMFGQSGEPAEAGTVEQAWQKVGAAMRSVMGPRK